MDSTNIRVLSQNCWGIPFLSLFRKERILALAKEISTGKYDIVALQEVWSEEDYTCLCMYSKSVLPYSHYFYTGVIGSGLCILSKGPILNTIIHQYSLNGKPHKIWHGDWFGGKCATLSILQFDSFIIHFYLTHTIAKYTTSNSLAENIVLKNYNDDPLNYFDHYSKTDDIYAVHRLCQLFELANFITLTSNSKHDAIILAGDLNCSPNELPIKLLLTYTGLSDSWQSYFNNSIINCECEDYLCKDENEKYKGTYIDNGLIQRKNMGKLPPHNIIKNDNFEFPETLNSDENIEDNVSLINSLEPKDSWTFSNPSNSFTVSQSFTNIISAKMSQCWDFMKAHKCDINNFHNVPCSGQRLDYILFGVVNQSVKIDCHRYRIFSDKVNYQHNKIECMSLSDHEGVLVHFSLARNKDKIRCNDSQERTFPLCKDAIYLPTVDLILEKALVDGNKESRVYKILSFALSVLLFVLFLYESCLKIVLSPFLSSLTFSVSIVFLRMNVYSFICFCLWMALVCHRTEVSALKNVRKTIELLRLHHDTQLNNLGV
ncbi:unnamed protein product [Gordionus sp. m RMFG-2023]|uniref:uncharacterized protein LOC135926657 n=1 Tax=Gordionus sp. m RMFG-2023 TaxID=3053472 RepID=UPI0030DF2377